MCARSRRSAAQSSGADIFREGAEISARPRRVALNVCALYTLQSTTHVRVGHAHRTVKGLSLNCYEKQTFSTSETAAEVHTKYFIFVLCILLHL